MSRHSTLLSLGAVVLVVGAASLIATGALHSPRATPTRSAPQPTPTPRATTPATLDLSGTWSGTCAGTANGFCTLTLMQTANGLDGNFVLWSPPLPPGKPLDITGNLMGSMITLRSATGVVFTGTLSGSTLSGAYNSNGKTYSWSVTLQA